MITLPPIDLPDIASVGRMALLLYAVYTSTNMNRFRSPLPPPANPDEVLYQAMYTAVEGHVGAQRVLRDVWSRVGEARCVRRRLL